MLIYNNNLDNQHRSTQKFAKRWFRPYVVKTANNNVTYHLAELDGRRIAVLIAEKWINAFKKQHKSEPNPEVEVESADEGEESDED